MIPERTRAKLAKGAHIEFRQLRVAPVSAFWLLVSFDLALIVLCYLADPIAATSNRCMPYADA